jgi:hypothetical protein
LAQQQKKKKKKPVNLETPQNIFLHGVDVEPPLWAKYIGENFGQIV